MVLPGCEKCANWHQYVGVTRGKHFLLFKSPLHCVTGAGPTHSKDWARFYTGYLSMSALYTRIWFHWIPRVAFLMGSDSQLVVKYNPILCHIIRNKLKPVFWSIDQPYTTENISTGINLRLYVWVLACNRVWTHQAWIPQSDRQRVTFCSKTVFAVLPWITKAISTWYLPMSALYTGICFHQIPTVAFLMGSDSQLGVNYTPMLCHISLTSLIPVFNP